MAKSAGGAGRRGRSGGGGSNSDGMVADINRQLATARPEQIIRVGTGTTTVGRRASTPRPTAAKKQAFLKKLEARMSQALARDNNARAMRISRAFRRASGVATKG